MYGPPIDRQEAVRSSGRLVTGASPFFSMPPPKLRGPFLERGEDGRRGAGAGSRWLSPPSSVSTSQSKSGEVISRPHYIKWRPKARFRRLNKTDYIDLQYQHRADYKVPTTSEVKPGVVELIREGKVRHFDFLLPVMQSIRACIKCSRSRR